MVEALQAPRAVSATGGGTAFRVLYCSSGGDRSAWEPNGPEGRQTGFVPAMILAETAPTVPASGRMVIVVGKDRRVIVDASVDGAALARVQQVLERR